MNSKEAFIELRKFLEEKHNEMFLTPVKLETFKGFKLDKIEQDLERLEQLEKENQELLINKNVAQKIAIKLKNDNDKLKNAIVSKKRIQSLRETANPIYEVVLHIPQNLLKEVLENEK